MMHASIDDEGHANREPVPRIRQCFSTQSGEFCLEAEQPVSAGCRLCGSSTVKLERLKVADEYCPEDGTGRTAGLALKPDELFRLFEGKTSRR